MMRIPAVIGLMSAAFMFLSTDEQQSQRLESRARTAAAAHRAETIKFTALRNQEIKASLAAVAARREADFVEARNSEITASLAAVENRRMAEFTQARNREIAASLAAVENNHDLAAFTEARNAEITASISTVDKAREIEFAAARNAEIHASIAAVAAQRELVALAAAWNREIEKSLAAVEIARLAEFAQARNQEIAASMAAVESQRDLVAFAAARNGEIAASVAAVENVRTTEFAAARNAEIKTAMMAYELQRTSTLAMARRRSETIGIETGSVETKAGVETRGVLPSGAQTPGREACQSMIRDVGPIYWARSMARIDGESRKRLDELATIANRCASMVIEIHGHSDTSGAPDANKRLSERRAQAIADYLVVAGVEARRVVAIGHGAEAPIVAGNQPESMACNRRIEFSVKDTSTGPNLSQILESLR